MRERIKTPPDDGGLWSGPKIALGYSIQQPRPQYPQAATQEERAALKKMEDAAAEEQCQHPDAEVEIWAMVEHRLGLKPIVRGMRAPIGARPVALGHHRFEWLYVFGFVEPATGRTVWNITNAVCKEMFEQVLADFAKSIGAGTSKRIVLQNDNAGWHGPQNLAVLDGIRFVFQPGHSPNCSPPSIFGPSSMNPLPTAASPRSKVSTRPSANAASHSRSKPR